jgi:hypothetical protein
MPEQNRFGFLTNARTSNLSRIILMAVVLMLGAASHAARPKAQRQETISLTAAGQKLEAKYAAKLAALQADISKALPGVDERKKAALQTASEAIQAAEKEAKAAEQALGKVKGAKGLVDHAKGKWIGGAEKEIAKAEAALKNATSDAQREAAKQELAKWQANKQEGLQALKERQAAWEKAKIDEPKLTEANRAAQAALAQSKASELAAAQTLLADLMPVLASNKLDAKLAKFVVLMEATPNGLAAFAEQGAAQQALIERLLSDDELLVQMLVADGANNGKYGAAMKIYSDIQKASPKAAEGTLQRLALAVALEHATPIKQQNIKSQSDAPEFVDPVKRYLHYEKAFLAGELDPGFKNLSVWDYRMVVNGEEPDDILAWGRDMLRNYRPDQINTSDERWRYVTSVRTDIRYGSQDVQFDQDDLHSFQNILMNGGICGRRAFFGRFILRAFGVPTTARPQKGHAALVRWTPDGWVACLGAGWGSGYTKTRYGSDLDFLANTQARAVGEPFMQVKRAQWIGDVLGEPRVFGLLSGSPGLWYGVSLYAQRAIIEAAKSKTLAAVGEDIAEANESKEKEVIAEVTLSEADREIVVGRDGTITIPAAACSKPTKSTGKIIFMPSNLGGMQLHYGRNGQHESFEYTIDAPAAGKYALTARVVTPSWKQKLSVAVNDASQLTEIALPFTVGKWETTQPVEIKLAKGKNVLRFSREGDVKGVSIKDFTLKPLK